jgi:hypothetical protein
MVDGRWRICASKYFVFPSSFADIVPLTAHPLLYVRLRQCIRSLSGLLPALRLSNPIFVDDFVDRKHPTLPFLSHGPSGRSLVRQGLLPLPHRDRFRALDHFVRPSSAAFLPVVLLCLLRYCIDLSVPVRIFLIPEAKSFGETIGIQGILGGVGVGLLFLPALSIQSHWFARRRNLAIGLVASGSSLGGIAFPSSSFLFSLPPPRRY